MTQFKVSVDDTEFQAACKAVSIAIMNLDATMKRMAENAVIEALPEEPDLGAGPQTAEPEEGADVPAAE